MRGTLATLHSMGGISVLSLAISAATALATIIITVAREMLRHLRFLSAAAVPKPSSYYTDQDAHGRTVLHRTAASLHLHKDYSRPEIDDLHALIRECPREALLLCESEGETLLHHCARRSAAEVRPGLWGRGGFAPPQPHRVWGGLIRSLLSRCPEAAGARNRDGNTPLHIVAKIANQWTTDVVRDLAEAWPPALEARNGQGETPLASLCDTYSHALALALRQDTPREAVIYGTDVYVPKHSPLSFMAKHFLPQAISLVKAAGAGSAAGTEATADSGEWKFLHACLALHSCPFDLAKLALKLCPNQIFEPDSESGNFPLHLAASNPGIPADAARTTIERLLDRRDKVAGVANSHGQYPLHLALMGGKTWDTGVGAIFEAAPEAVVVRDEVSGLFPFMLAACVEGRGKEEQTPCITTIYTLLRSAPEMERFKCSVK